MVLQALHIKIGLFCKYLHSVQYFESVLKNIKKRCSHNSVVDDYDANVNYE